MRDPGSRHISSFVILAEELHFGRASARLGIAQPALTQQINALEGWLECQLLHRRPRVALTEAGRIFLAGSQRVLEDLAVVTESTRRVGRGDEGTLAIGVVSSTLLLPSVTKAFRRFARQHPGVKLNVMSMDTVDQVEALKRGRIDLGLMRDPAPDPLLRHEEILREKFVMALPSNHRLARRKRLPLSALKDEPFVLFPRRVNPGIHDRIFAVCRAAGFEPQVIQEIEDVHARLGIVAAGLGVTVTAESLTRLHQTTLAFRTIDGPDVWTGVAIGSVAGRPLPPPADAFVRMVLGRR
jgi:LysR family transcriptional regulator, benzoate and cis,cis-muconate-responsive activator of ben and cat genes